MSDEEKAIYFDKKLVIDQESLFENRDFWIILACSILGVILLISIICLFCSISKANKSIVSEVEIMDNKPTNLSEKH